MQGATPLIQDHGRQEGAGAGTHVFLQLYSRYGLLPQVWAQFGIHQTLSQKVKQN